MHETGFLAYTAAIIASCYLCRDAYLHRFLPIARPLMGMSIILALTCLLRLIRLIDSEPTQWFSQASRDIEFFLLLPLVFPFWVWVLLEYFLDKKIRPTHNILLLFYIQPVIVNTLALSDIVLNGFLSQASDAALIDPKNRLGAYLGVRYVYSAIIMTGLTLLTPYLVKKLRQSSLPNLIMVSLSLCIPYVLYILHRGNLVSLPLGVPLFTFFIIWGSRQYRLLDALPLALNGIMDKVNAGVLVSNAHSKLLYINDYAQKLFGLNVSDRELQQRELAIPDVFAQYFDFSKAEKQTALIQIKNPAENTCYIDTVFQPIFHPELDKHLGATISLYDITQRKQTELELQQYARELEALSEATRKARDDALEANAAKSRFLAVMSQELKAPLSNIISRSQNTGENYDQLSDETCRNSMGHIKTSGHQLLAMINQILDLSKVDVGKIELNNQVVQLADVLTSIIAESQLLADRNQNTFKLVVAKDLKPCWGDAERIRQIMLNLLSNAAKFTENDEILITAANDDDQTVQISVEDHGIGMNDDQVSHLFQDFQQVESSTSRKYGGTGLGLSISRKLARTMNGDISLTSATGEGSCFILHLPVYNGQQTQN